MNSAMRIFKLLSFTSSPSSRPIDSHAQFSSVSPRKDGCKGSSVRKISKVLSLVVGASLLLGGCKAQSDLTITLQDKSSGTVNFSLELDEPAASAVRSDSFNSRNLVQAFDTKELEDAGFKVKVSDNKTVTLPLLS